MEFYTKGSEARTFVAKIGNRNRRVSANEQSILFQVYTMVFSAHS